MASTLNVEFWNPATSLLSLPTFLNRLPLYWLWTGIAVLSILFFNALEKYTQHTINPDLPVAGKKWSWEPRIVTRYRFLLSGWEICRDALENHHGSAVTVLRPASNMIVLPPRYVEELRNVPDTQLDALASVVTDFHDEHTGVGIIHGTHLNYNVVRRQLTPRLGGMMPELGAEMEDAIKAVMPPCKDDWVSIDLAKTMTRVVSRMASHIWFGDNPVFREEAWTTLNMEVIENICFTALIFKSLPGILHPILGRILPPKRKLWRSMDRVHSYVVPLVEERRKREALMGESYSKPNDMLQWFMDDAGEDEHDPTGLSMRYIFAVLGSLYLVSNAMVDVLYDLTARPEYLEPLREEARRVLAEDGGWINGTDLKLTKMDSFMKESQRVNSPSPLSFKRVAMEKMVLSDGLVLPEGAYVCGINAGTVGAVSDDFDGFRYCKLREEAKSNPRQHMFTSTDPNHMTFGHGRLACPGRFLAAVEIKMMLASFIDRYEISFGSDRGRPKNLHLMEWGFVNPSIRVQVRERQIE